MAMVNLLGELKERGTLDPDRRARQPLCDYAAQCAFAAFLRLLLTGGMSTTRESAETANTTVNAHKRCRAARRPIRSAGR
jgi:hypothetical protein